MGLRDGRTWSAPITTAADQTRAHKVIYFALAVLGFSFWFFAAVPFASHRETYAWLAGSTTQTVLQQFSFGGASTYRPLSQAVIFPLFLWLDAGTFPTSVVRQGVLQGLVYTLFVTGWWLLYRSAPQRRVFAALALVAGAVLFSGYVHLFHIYGLMYVPVILTLGAVIGWNATDRLEANAPWLALVTTVLVLWHPFAAALFVACYAGFYLERFHIHDGRQHLKTLLLLLVPTVGIFCVVVLFGRDSHAVDSRLAAFLASYRTNEVNIVASAVVLMLACVTALSMVSSIRRGVLIALIAAAAGVAFLANGLPVLFVWFGIVLVKLWRMRLWSVFLLMLATALLPFGGATGTPIHALFAIIVATYATALGSETAERALSLVPLRYAVGVIAVALIVVTLVRSGMDMPVVSGVARPLLAERERTYQLEHALAWMHRSPYCRSAIAFVDPSGSPAESVESAIDRRHRPPAGIQDVQLFWNTILRCEPHDDGTTAVVTFGEPSVTGFTPVYRVEGRYANGVMVSIGRTNR